MDEDEKNLMTFAFGSVLILLGFLGFIIFIAGCGEHVAKTQGPFTHVDPGPEMKIGKAFLSAVYHRSWEIDPYVWKGTAEQVQGLCGPEAGACLVGNDILIVEGEDTCVAVAHELAHYYEWLHGEIDYDHTGPLKDWYGRQVFLICDAIAIK